MSKVDSNFGHELVLDLYDCDLKKISSGKEIKKFAAELCDKVIKMKRYGAALTPHFGHANPIASGYSLVQLIETSSVTAHFSEYKLGVYLNIFSCVYFDPVKTKNFCMKFFGAKKMKARFLKRI